MYCAAAEPSLDNNDHQDINDLPLPRLGPGSLKSELHFVGGGWVTILCQVTDFVSKLVVCERTTMLPTSVEKADPSTGGIHPICTPQSYVAPVAMGKPSTDKLI